MSAAHPHHAELFEALFETAPDAVIVVDRDGRIVLANAQAGRLFGYDEHGLLGLAIEALLPESLRAGHGAHRARFMANPRARPMGAGYELVGRRSDGSEFPVEIGLSPVRAGDNPLYAAAIRDISETQRARQALVRARYDAVVGDVGRLALESPDFESLLQRLPEIVAATLSVDAVAIFLSDGQRREFRARASQGIPAELLDRLSALFGRDGWAARVSSGGSDALLDPGNVSQTGDDSLRKAVIESGFRDAAAQALFDHYEPVGVLLALGNEARTFDRDKLQFLQSITHLLNAALQRSHSVELLAHAQRLDAIGQLTGGVAHDFNNLLTVISGNLQLLEEEDGIADRAQIIQSALRAVGNGAALTRKLLAFARRQRLSPRSIAPGPWLTELSTLLTRTLGETVAIRIECGATLPNVFADPGELDAALVNLALNARDAMPRGGELSITVGEREIVGRGEIADLAPGRYVTIRVADTGIGMTSDVLARVLEPFFTTKAAGKGSGLGLSMVYGFARQSGGAITIDSQLGYGTRVALFLPSAPAEPDPVRTRERLPSSRGGETVLVVEDEPDVQGIAVSFLRSLGYSSRVAGSAEEALDLLREDTAIDLLFSDVVLGSGMSGLDLAHAARRQHPHLRVLLTSGYEHAVLNRGDNQVGLKLLRKPYSREDFSSAIRQALDPD
jgi:PAS domain S-box-containing protein